MFNNGAKNFTKQELLILHMLAKGMTSQAIATELNLSKHTVDNHRKNMLRKTHCTNMSELLVWCIVNGTIDHDPALR